MQNLVQISNNQVTTSSLIVAECFDKRHRDVLRSIKMLKCSKEFNARNFAPVEYKDQKGEKRTYYNITRDGWTFLVMGFTGLKAAEWKEKYIAAFNAMEAELRKRQDKPVEVVAHNRALPSGKKEIVLSEKAKTEISGLVKTCSAVACRQELNKTFDDLVFRETIKSIVREAVRDEVADYLLKDGVKQGTFNTFPTADGLPAISWVMSISHGATALYNLINQYQKRQKDAVALLESKKC